MINRQLIDQMRKENPFIPLNDVIYEIIKEEIVLFHLYPNSRVRESVIADNLGISRSPVKDALEHLEAESYVVKTPGSGYRVASFSRAEYTGIMDLAFLLEPYAAGQAAKIMTDDQLDFLYSTAKEMHDLYKEEEKENTNKNYRRMIALEYAFHSSIVSFAQNPLLNQVYDQIKDKLLRYRCYLVYNPPIGMYDALGDDHLVICNVLKLKSRELAEGAMKRHLTISSTVFKDQIVFDKYDNYPNSRLELDRSNY